MENLMEKFINECMVINMKIEYEDYKGEVKFGIATSLCEKDLVCKYGDVLELYKPYILLPEEIGEIISDFRKNEDIYRKRYVRKHDMYDVTDTDFTNYHPECAFRSAEDEYMHNKDLGVLRGVYETLTEIEKRRMDMYYYAGFTLREIADIEGTSLNAVNKSIRNGLKKLKNFW